MGTGGGREDQKGLGGALEEVFSLRTALSELRAAKEDEEGRLTTELREAHEEAERAQRELVRERELMAMSLHDAQQWGEDEAARLQEEIDTMTAEHERLSEEAASIDGNEKIQMLTIGLEKLK